MKIGVLALQGAFIEHIHMLNKIGVDTLSVRKQKELERLDGLIIPGGESTTILKLMHHYGLFDPIRKMAREGKPIMGTCAGMILLADRVSDDNMQTLGLMNISVRRNAFGRQVDSFEADIAMPCLGEKHFHAVFIRAPFVENASGEAEVLSKLENGNIVAVRQHNLLALAFHPELSHDARLHKYFLEIAKSPLTQK